MVVFLTSSIINNVINKNKQLLLIAKPFLKTQKIVKIHSKSVENTSRHCFVFFALKLNNNKYFSWSRVYSSRKSKIIHDRKCKICSAPMMLVKWFEYFWHFSLLFFKLHLRCEKMWLNKKQKSLTKAFGLNFYLK